jgi:hypothetical protein
MGKAVNWLVGTRGRDLPSMPKDLLSPASLVSHNVWGDARNQLKRGSRSKRAIDDALGRSRHCSLEKCISLSEAKVTQTFQSKNAV